VATLRDDAARRRAFVLGCVFAAGLVAVALVLVVQERATDDPYETGTIHEVTLLRQTPCTAVWIASPDGNHEWQTDGPVPANWTDDSVDGTLQVAADWGESTVVVGDDTVNVFGGKLSAGQPFTVAC
jgi:hypothetical protein